MGARRVGTPGPDIDVLLAEPVHLVGAGAALAGRIEDRGPRIVSYAWQLDRGAAGCLTKRLSGAELHEALAAIRRGETVVRPLSLLLDAAGGGVDGDGSPCGSARSWP